MKFGRQCDWHFGSTSAVADIKIVSKLLVVQIVPRTEPTVVAGDERQGP